MPELYLKKEIIRSWREEPNESDYGEEYISENSYIHKITVVKIPMSFENILAIVVIVLLALLGTYYLYKMATKQYCRCKL